MHHHHQHLHQEMVKRAPVPDLTTINGVVMSVVYVTAVPTFTGVIGSYSTVTGGDDTTTQQQQQTTASQISQIHATAASTAASANSVASVSSKTSNSIINLATVGVSSSSTSSAVSLISATSAALSSTAISSTLTTSALVSSGSSSTSTGIAAAATTDSSVAPAESTTSGGMSTGAKAGLAIGIILLIGAIAGLCLFLLGKKRKQREQKSLANNEKTEPVSDRGTPAATSSPVAPRLSLRPVSRLVPDMMGGSRPKSSLNQGNMLTTFNAPNARNLSPAEAAGTPAHHAVTHTPTTQEDNPFQDPQNPFADPEKFAGLNNSVPITAANVTTAPANASSPVFSEKPLAAHPESASPPSVPAPLVFVPTPAQALPIGRKPVPAPMSIPQVNSLGAGAPAPVVAQGPGPEGGQGNVYRIMMDFNPTMEDELGLQAGQHVRMLHEYDDGWALCIRLDRSQQGVVPRTCLANKPSKPRPTPSSNGPRFRPGPPIGRPNSIVSRSMPPTAPPGRVASPPIGTPSSSRPTSTSPRQRPSTGGATSPGAFNQAPRPLSPGPRPQKRSMSPGPYGAGGPKPMAGIVPRRRSNSANALSVRERRNSPPGPSKLGPGTPTLRPDSRGPDSPGLAM